MENKESFEYTYSAKQQKEIQNIRKKYIAVEDSKLEQLRRLDAGASQKATTVALVIGIIGALVLGTGMSLAMSDLSQIFGAYQQIGLVVGIVIGLVGIALVSVAYPIHNFVLRRERERIAPEILRLTDELMK